MRGWLKGEEKGWGAKRKREMEGEERSGSRRVKGGREDKGGSREKGRKENEERDERELTGME